MTLQADKAEDAEARALALVTELLAGDRPQLAGLIDATMAEEMAPEVLRAALAEVWRRMQRLKSEDSDGRDDAQAIAHELQATLLKREEADAKRRAVKLDSTVKGRVLRELAAGPHSPGDLAERIGATKEAVSRALAALAKDGLVSFDVDETDTRRRRYSLSDSAELTRAGEFQYARLALYGDQSRPDSSALRAHAELHITELIEGAVAARRRLNAVDSSMAQLESLVRTCVQGGFDGLELWARRELATSQRQAGARQYTSQMRRLRAIAAGESRRLPRRAALPALGHYSYERGRSLCGSRPDSAIHHLMTSLHTFAQLCEIDRDSREWPRWQAWATYGAADALRHQAQLVPALQLADKAVRAFGACGDDYGLAMSTFLAGFCMRMRGDFDLADLVLRQAFRMTEEHRFERLRVECLLQLGESHRSQGDLEAAEEELTAAVANARDLHHAVALAFAQSSLGALAYEKDDLDRAVAEQKAAVAAFGRIQHQLAGRALALRRLGLARFMAYREAKSSQRQTVRALAEVSQAEKVFRSLFSPAGEIGCHIAEVQITLELGRNEGAVDRGVAAMVRWFERNPQNYRYVAQDLWAPRSLQRLLVDVDSKLLRPVAERLGHFADTERATRDHERLFVAQGLDSRPHPESSKRLPSGREAKAEQMASEPPLHVDQIPFVVA